MPRNLLTRAAAVAPQTVNDQARTIDVVWSTGAAVERRDAAGPYLENLSLDPAHVDLSRLVGASVLDAHQQTSLSHVLGTVLTAAVERHQGTATLQFSSRPDVQPIWQDIRAGILKHISVGYTVEQWQDGRAEDGRRVRTAVRWTPQEISFVPSPADPGATTRTAGVTMPEDQKTTDPNAAASDFQPCPDCQTPNGCRKLGACVKDADAEAPASDAASPAGNDERAGRPQTRAAVNQAIRSAARTAGLPTTFADTLIDRHASIDQARAAVLDEMARRSAPAIRSEQTRVEWVGSHDDPSTRASQMGEAMFARMNPAHTLSEPARRYAYATPADMARELLQLRGISTTGMSPAALITRSLHTTSDFAVICGDTVSRTLRQSFAAAPSGLKQVARQTTAKDFRSKTSVMLSEAPILEKLTESGEIKSGTLAEAKEAYAIGTYAQRISISRHTLVNDDLGAFADLARRYGQAAAQTEAKLLVDILEANAGAGPTMSDGSPLFHSSHLNLGTAGAISDTTLGEARLKIRTQKGLKGQIISATPKFLVVPAALETAAEKWLATIAPAQADDVNPFAGKLTLVVEPRLSSATRYYVVADPAELDGLEFSYLAGGEGPNVESKSGWEVDGVEVRVLLDVGAGFVEWRSWVANAGA